MFKKILVCTDLTKYCDYVFSYGLNMAKEYDATLWIYYGLGRLHLSEEEATQEIKRGEASAAEAYVDKIKKSGLEKYTINVSYGDIVSEITKLARSAEVDIILMGPSSKEPSAVGEQIRVAPLGPVTTNTILWASCPVMVIPPALLPGLTRR